MDFYIHANIFWNQDLGSQNMYDAGVALNGLSCFLTPDLARDLANDIMTLVRTLLRYVVSVTKIRTVYRSTSGKHSLVLSSFDECIFNKSGCQDPILSYFILFFFWAKSHFVLILGEMSYFILFFGHFAFNFGIL